MSGFTPLGGRSANHVNMTASERAARYVSAMPPGIEGQRGSDATFAAAHAVANGFALDEETALAVLMAHFNPRCLPPWSVGELRHKVRDALRNPSERGRGNLLRKGETRLNLAPLPLAVAKWPDQNPARIAAIVKEGPLAVELTMLSPGPLDCEDAGHNAAPIVQALFTDADHSDPLLCIGKSSREFATRQLSYWLSTNRLAEFSFIVPAQMTAKTGFTKTGKLSEHALENTGARSNLIVEFDKGTIDDHAARLWHLANYGPLALVVHSGGKSLHGWFRCQGMPETALRKFMAYAVSLGADKATWTRSQFVRLPAGQRDNGCRQSVFYFDPAKLRGTEPEPGHE